MNQRKLNGRQSRWIEEIWCYEHQIKWTPGDTNLADPFSRRPDHEPEVTINALLDTATHALNEHREDIKQGYLHDAFYLDPSHKRLTPLRQENGLWYYRHRLCIPDDNHSANNSFGNHMIPLMQVTKANTQPWKACHATSGGGEWQRMSHPTSEPATAVRSTSLRPLLPLASYNHSQLGLGFGGLHDFPTLNRTWT
mgnify:CR=1 FL=1